MSVVCVQGVVVVLVLRLDHEGEASLGVGPVVLDDVALDQEALACFDSIRFFASHTPFHDTGRMMWLPRTVMSEGD